MDAASRDALKRAKAAGEAELEMNDVLAAMASTLVKQSAHVYHVEMVPDPLPRNQDTVDKKPPKEVFYRKTSTFATELPSAVLPKRCTCQYLCTGAPATIKCLSCVMYDPKGVGFFCKLCYDARHPWYRVPHMFIDISLDESIEHTLRVAHRRAEMIRFERDGTDLLDNVKSLGPVLQFVGDDFKVDSQLKSAGHMATKLEDRIRNFRREMRRDVRRKGLSVPFNEDEAAIVIGKYYRRWRVRMWHSVHYINRLRRIKNSIGALTYYDTKTNSVLMKRPSFLLQSHIKYVQSHQAEEAVESNDTRSSLHK